MPENYLFKYSICIYFDGDYEPIIHIPILHRNFNGEKMKRI